VARKDERDAEHGCKPVPAPAQGSPGEPENVLQWEMPGNLAEMADEEIEELARRIYADALKALDRPKQQTSSGGDLDGAAGVDHGPHE